MLEMKILEMNSSVKKLIDLKKKIINTDTLIRKYKEQKDEVEKLLVDKQQLIEEREKCERLCTKYEVELKVALEDVHNLRQCEKEYKSATSIFESKITSLHDSLQAEKALVKQYKSLVEKEEKADEQIKDKVAKDFEKKLSKKEEEVQRAREKTRDVSKKLSLLSKSHNKALKFIQKIGNHPALQGLLPAGDKRILNNFLEVLQKGSSIFKAENGNHSDDEEDEIWGEGQYLEDLLMESVPTEEKAENVLREPVTSGSNCDTQMPVVNGDSNHVALNSAPDESQKNIIVKTETAKETLPDNSEVSSVSGDSETKDNHVQCKSADSVTVNHENLCSVSMPVMSNVSCLNDNSNKQIAVLDTVENCVTHDCDSFENTVDRGTVTDFPEDTDKISGPDNDPADENNHEFEGKNVKESENDSDTKTVSEVLVVSNGEDSSEVGDKLQDSTDSSFMEVEDDPEGLTKGHVNENDDVGSVASEVNNVMDHLLNSTSDTMQTADDEHQKIVETLCGDPDLTAKEDASNAESECEEGMLVIATDDEPCDTAEGHDTASTNTLPGAEETCITEDLAVDTNNTGMQRATSDFTLPLIPFSDDRKFQPTAKCPSDPSALFKSDSVDDETETRKKKVKKQRNAENKVDKICSRMKTSIVLECPVSPLPPSPPLSPLETESGKSFTSEASSVTENNISQENQNIAKLFGSDSEDESPAQVSKTFLQHQESEGFEPESEHQDVQNDGTKHEVTNRREAIRRVGYKTKQLEVLHCGGSDRSNEPYDRREARSSLVPVNRRPLENDLGSRLFTDFSMDPSSGRCKISIRLPENLTSSTNVRFELDTMSRQIHLDYGPSQFTSPELSRQPYPERNSNFNGSDRSPSPKVTLPDDSPKLYRPALSSPYNAVELENNSTSCNTKKSSFIQGRPLRRATVPPIRPSLQRLAAQKRTVTFEDNDRESSLNGSVETSEETNLKPCPFKTPPVRKLSSSILHRHSPNGTPKTDTQNLSDEKCLEHQETQPGDKGLPSNGSNGNITSLHIENGDVTVPKVKKRKRKNISPQRPHDFTKKLFGAGNHAPSESSTQKNPKMSAPISLPTNPKIVKALKPLLKVQVNNEKNPAIFTKLFKTLCNATLCPSPDDLVTASLVFFSSCPVNVLTFLSRKKDSQMPLLTPKEEVFVSLITHLKEKQAHLSNMIDHFLARVSVELNRTLEACPTGLASLCRLHTVLCRQVGYVQLSQDLCYHLVLRKHPHAAYLIANVLVVWPFILELYCSPAHWNLRKKIFSLFLMGNQSDSDEQTCKVLKDLGHLEYSEEDCVPDTLAAEMVDLLALSDDLRGNEDVCQQLLLLAYMQGWCWTKDKVLPSILTVFDSVSGNNKAPIIRLIGSFLHYCGPKTKEESEYLLLKLECKFKELIDDDFLLKEACTHSLLSLAGQLDGSTVTQMKSWLQNHKMKLSPHLLEDFVNSGFLT